MFDGEIATPRTSKDSAACHTAGHNRLVCFCSEQEMIAYAGWLKQYAKEVDIQVHASVLMTKHAHLPVTPKSDQGVNSNNWGQSNVLTADATEVWFNLTPILLRVGA